MGSSEGLVAAGLTVRWRGRPVLDSVGLSIRPGEFVTLMGPNGSGKSTLLRALAGFEPTATGAVALDGRALEGVPPHRRGIGLLFQEAVLLPRRTVWENVAFGPQVQQLAAAEVELRVDAALDLLRLRSLADRPGDALSGGERQRVALARALAARPRLVLLDEPFASVDPELRADLRAEFRRALTRAGVSTLHVTHDREEGLFLGDRVLLLLDGRIVQSGPPAEVFESPTSAAVARFLGYNVVDVQGRPTAVHPREVRLTEGTGPGPTGRVVASGPVGHGWVAFVEATDGVRYEVHGAEGGPPPMGAERHLTFERLRPLSA